MAAVDGARAPPAVGGGRVVEPARSRVPRRAVHGPAVRPVLAIVPGPCHDPAVRGPRGAPPGGRAHDRRPRLRAGRDHLRARAAPTGRAGRWTRPFRGGRRVRAGTCRAAWACQHHVFGRRRRTVRAGVARGPRGHVRRVSPRARSGRVARAAAARVRPHLPHRAGRHLARPVGPSARPRLDPGNRPRNAPPARTPVRARWKPSDKRRELGAGARAERRAGAVTDRAPLHADRPRAPLRRLRARRARHDGRARGLRPGRCRHHRARPAFRGPDVRARGRHRGRAVRRRAGPGAEALGDSGDAGRRRGRGVRATASLARNIRGDRARPAGVRCPLRTLRRAVRRAAGRGVSRDRPAGQHGLAALGQPRRAAGDGQLPLARRARAHARRGRLAHALRSRRRSGRVGRGRAARRGAAPFRPSDPRRF